MIGVNKFYLGGDSMTLGEKLRQARLEAGFSQRQLCGDEITRNMLSQIEHDTAHPSMDTLRYLAGKLGKSLGYFLDEEGAGLPNLGVIRRARAAWAEGNWKEVIRALEDYRGPDEAFDPEKEMLQALGHLGMARNALEESRRLYALELLARVEPKGYLAQELERRKLLLLARAGGKVSPEQLHSLDEELLARAAGTLETGGAERALALLDAAEDQKNPAWQMLRGRAFLALGDYAQAAACLENAEDPGRLALLEVCYREMGDFRKAYEYACQQRESE